jgi:hypothetical protein
LGEVLEARLPAQPVRVQAIESLDSWFLDFAGLDSRLVQLIQSSSIWQVDDLLAEASLPLDYLLRLYIVRQIFRLQGIRAETVAGPIGEITLRLHIPAATDVAIGPMNLPA